MRVGLQFIDNDEERDLRYVLLLSKQYLRNCNHNFCQTFTLRSRSTCAFTFALSFPSHAPSWRKHNNVNFRSGSFKIKRYIRRQRFLDIFYFMQPSETPSDNFVHTCRYRFMEYGRKNKHSKSKYTTHMGPESWKSDDTIWEITSFFYDTAPICINQRLYIMNHM